VYTAIFIWFPSVGGYSAGRTSGAGGSSSCSHKMRVSSDNAHPELKPASSSS
jgi:hypothetical protein